MTAAAVANGSESPASSHGDETSEAINARMTLNDAATIEATFKV
jgi:hypothetical protein